MERPIPFFQMFRFFVELAQIFVLQKLSQWQLSGEDAYLCFKKELYFCISLEVFGDLVLNQSALICLNDYMPFG